jgi:cysteine desulfuration protein SufE
MEVTLDNPIPRKLSALLDEMSALDEDTRFELLIEYAEKFKEVPSEIATRPFQAKDKVPACESEAFLWAIPIQDEQNPTKKTAKFYFAVENPQGISAKALAVILDETLSHAPIEQIKNIPEDMIYRLFGHTVSMGKGLGLMSMVSMLKARAIALAR